MADEAWVEEYKKSFDIWLMQNVGLKPEVMTAIQQAADDWTFVIKICALIEVALNHMLLGQLSKMSFDQSVNAEVGELLERLTIQGKTSKIAFARAFRLLPSNAIPFIQCMSGIRRKLVHDIADFEFDLAGYFKTLDDTQGELKQWKNALTFGSSDAKMGDIVLRFPHFAIWHACMRIFAMAFNAQPLDVALLYRSMLDKLSEKQSESNPTEPG